MTRPFTRAATSLLLAACVVGATMQAAPAEGPGDPGPDTTPPVITITKPPAVWNGWYAGDTKVSLTAKDSGSSIESVTYELSGVTIGSGTGPATVTITAQGHTTLTVHAADSEGNTATATADIAIDRSGPVITSSVNGGDVYARGSLVHIAYSCDDALTPIATCAGDVEPGALIDTGSDGPHVITLRSTDMAGNASTRQITYTVKPQVKATSTPLITGASSVGSTLGVTGVDFDPAPDSVSYVWLRDGVAKGAGPTYGLSVADLGAKIAVRVRAVKAGYDPVEVTSAATTPIENGTFAITGVPGIAGTTAVGKVLTYVPPPISPAPDSVGLLWLRNGTSTGVTGATYQLGPDDLGAKLSVSVAYNSPGYYTAVRESATTAPVALGQLAVSTAPGVTGTARVGRTLVATPPSVTPAAGTVTYQWLRNDVEIAGATTGAYKLTAVDLGKKIAVRATAARTGYASASSVSGPTATVVKALPSVTASARARGGKRVRVYVTVRTTGFTPTGTVTVKRGSKTVAKNRRLSGGRVTIDLTRQSRGRTRYTIVYSGSSTVYGKTVRTAYLRVR